MKNKDYKKLSKLTLKKEKGFLKNSEVVASMMSGISTGAMMAAAWVPAVGVGRALIGADMQRTAAMAAVVASGLVAGTSTRECYEIEPRLSKRQKVAAFATAIAASTLSAALGAGIGVGTHKLTTSIIDKLQPAHQIEQTVETEPMPAINEIQMN